MTLKFSNSVESCFSKKQNPYIFLQCLNYLMEPKKSVDCIGMFCPMPLFMARKAIEEVEVGDVVVILADDPTAKKDIPEWAERAGHKVISIEEDSGVYVIKIQRGV